MKPRDKELKAILRDRPDDVAARCELARWLADRQRRNEAERVLADGLARRPDDAGLLLAVADLHWECGRIDQAAEHVERAAAAGADQAVVTSMHAGLAFDRFQWARVVELLGPLAEGGAAGIPELCDLAEALLELERAADALPHVEALLRLDAGDSRHHRLMAWALLDLDRADRANFHADKALELDPDDEDAMLTKVSTLDRVKGLEATTEWLAEWLETRPRSVRGHLELAELYDESQYLGSAIDVGRRLVRAVPDHRKARLDLASRLMRAGIDVEAADHLRRALALPSAPGTSSDADAAEARIMLTTVAMRLSRLEEADLHIEALARIPGVGEFADVGSLRGQLAMARSKPAEAEGHFRAAVAADPDFAMAWSGLAAALAALGRHAEGLEAVDRAIAVDREDEVLLLQRIDLLESLGRTDEAAEARRELERLAGAPQA